MAQGHGGYGFEYARKLCGGADNAIDGAHGEAGVWSATGKNKVRWFALDPVVPFVRKNRIVPCASFSSLWKPVPG
jgi:hypothetical protein